MSGRSTIGEGGRRASSHRLASIALVAMVACKGTAVDPPGAAPSPQAKAEPAPLANPLAASSATATTFVSADAGPAPEPLRSDRPVPADTPREALREPGAKEQARDAKELSGYALQAVLRTGEGPAAPKGPEVSAAAIEVARRKTEARMAVEMSQTRARVVLSGGFVLPAGAELRARADRYGHLFFWPGEEAYRVAEPGALRALLGERRLDVAPLSQATVVSSGEGARRLNMRTRRVEISTRAAKATIEIAALRDAGDGGVLLCRMLLDLMSAPYSTSTCGTDDVPLHAELRWTTQGALSFDVTAVAKRNDLPAQTLATPPPSATFASDPLPPSPGESLLGKPELASLRSAPVDPPVAVLRDAQAPPPESGLVLVNTSDEPYVAWLDGIAVAWVAPAGRLPLSALTRGRYAMQWRTFLGDGWSAPETISVPATIALGVSDAGVR